jgi:hypothetical protein
VRFDFGFDRKGLFGRLVVITDLEIEGDVEELEGLIETLQEAIEHGCAQAAMLDADGVSEVRVIRS